MEMSDGVVRVRAWQIDEAAVLDELLSDPLVLAELREDEREAVLGTSDAALHLINQCDPNETHLAICAPGACGLVTLNRIAESSDWEISVAVLAARRGEGVARRAIELASRWWLAKGAANLHAVIRQSNTPSRRLFESAGYRLSGPHPDVPASDIYVRSS